MSPLREPLGEPALFGLRAPARWVVFFGGFWGLVGLVCLAVRPVSYTHLRAHETVLDLVCRLLLEKKKT